MEGRVRLNKNIFFFLLEKILGKDCRRIELYTEDE